MTAPLRPLVFADLDGFLFELPEIGCTNVSSDSLPLEFACSDRPQAMMNLTQSAFFQWLSTSTTVVPTTGRSSNSYKRIRLPFHEPAICSFGGVILLNDGQPDRRWAEIMRDGATKTQQTLSALKQLIDEGASKLLGDNLYGKIVSDFGIEQYAKVGYRNGLKQESDAALIVDFLVDQLPIGWYVHHNAHQVCVMPPHLRKENAVRFYLENLAPEHSFVIGGGDSLSDLPFIGCASYALFPVRSQVVTTLSTIEGSCRE